MSSTSPTSSVLRDRIPTVSCHNPHRINLGVDWTELLAALQEYVDQHFAPVWHTPVKIIDGKHGVRAQPGHWQLVFLKKNDQEQGIKGLLGFHDLTEHGQPLAKVFVDEVERNHEQVSVTASHELGEMLVDPWIHMGVRGPDENSWYAYETSDAVEVGPTVDVRGLPMSNFVYPEWFGAFPGPKFDHRGQCTRPFEIMEGGFVPIFRNGEWALRKADGTDVPIHLDSNGNWVLGAGAHIDGATHARVTRRPNPARRLSDHAHLFQTQPSSAKPGVARQRPAGSRSAARGG